MVSEFVSLGEYKLGEVAPDTPAALDREVAELARRQHGVVSARQLGRLGVGRNRISRWTKRGRLHRLHRGVYAVGHRRLTDDGHLIAAVLAVGTGAALSHRSAAATWGLRQTLRRAVEVTTARSAESRPGIQVHRTVHLEAVDVTSIRGIPVTAIPRTLIDLAEVLPRLELERALDQLAVARSYDGEAIAHSLDRHAHRPGAARLRATLAAHDAGTTVTRSELEERFLALCRSARLPLPELNVRLALPRGERATVDAIWRGRRLVVELDGRRTHLTPAAFERDRRRDAVLVAAGYRVVRFTWRQVTTDPEVVVALLAHLTAPAAAAPAT
jgi:predicted transcriptional regulator of viral defense system/very-short-patch-repair endonuclease